MRKFYFLLFILFFFRGFSQFRNSLSDENQFNISLKSGLDFPSYSNQTKYIDYKKKLGIGLSFDYYFNWLGLGFDFDYLKNNIENNYPENIFYKENSPIIKSKLDKENLERNFLGIGPNFRKILNDNSSIDFKLRGGISHIKGGKLTLYGDDAFLNYHSGYNQKNVFSTKAELSYRWFFSEYIGLTVGSYFLMHYNVKDLDNSKLSYKHISFNSQSNFNVLDFTNTVERTEPIKHNISSVGIFLGLNFRIPNKEKSSSKKNHVYVTARDRETGLVIPNVKIELKKKDKIIYVGKTNLKGTAVFKFVKPDDYEVNSNLYNVNLSQSKISKIEFSKNQVVKKDIINTDNTAIVKGTIKNCDPKLNLSGTSVIVKNLKTNTSKELKTTASGDFFYILNKNEEFAIYAKKAGFSSRREIVDSRSFKKSNLILVDLSFCDENVSLNLECGKVINLKNIHYDLDKYEIREDAKKELDLLIKYLNDNSKATVELSSHTDSRASDNYNIVLSQKRAEAAVNYMIEQGVHKDRLKAIGYGERKLLNGCSDGVDCTEEEHQINRRTEIIISCPK